MGDGSSNAMTTVLTIAGFDPSSGAGITADLAVFAAHGLFGTSAITALTVQSTMGVAGVQPVAAEVLRATLDCLEDDLPPEGIKIGMLGTAECVAVVASYLEGLRRSQRHEVKVVLDPVLRSSSGSGLLEPAGVDLLRERLLPLVDWITPNGDELALLAGTERAPGGTRAGLAEMTLAFRLEMCPETSLLVTGGDLVEPDDLVVSAAVRRGEPLWLPGERIATSSTHGTGCALSSALLCRLVLGDEAESAARAAKGYVTEALRSAVPIGNGHGPMNHAWPMRRSVLPS